MLKNQCMGVYQFPSKSEANRFHDLIRPIVETHTGLNYVDALSYYEAERPKMDLIYRLIEESMLIIIDITLENANVFTELGIAYSLRKPLILICEESAFQTKWQSHPPFDIQGRELIVFSNEDDLKIKLGQNLLDALYKSSESTMSWIPTNANGQVRSASELILTGAGVIWSALPIHRTFVLNAEIEAKPKEIGGIPDFRIYLTTGMESLAKAKYPLLMIICPWEYREIDKLSIESHIDFFSTEKDGNRIVQAPVKKDDLFQNLSFRISLLFSYPNLVFESSLFEKVDRLCVSMEHLRLLGYPYQLNQHIGFESPNANVTIKKIRIKEVTL